MLQAHPSSTPMYLPKGMVCERQLTATGLPMHRLIQRPGQTVETTTVDCPCGCACVCQRHGPGSFNLIRIAHPITGDHACVMILDCFCCIPRKSCRYSFSQELMSKGRIKHKGSTYIYIYIYLSIYTPARNPLSTALIRYLHDSVMP